MDERRTVQPNAKLNLILHCLVVVHVCRSVLHDCNSVAHGQHGDEQTRIGSECAVECVHGARHAVSRGGDR